MTLAARNFTLPALHYFNWGVEQHVKIGLRRQRDQPAAKRLHTQRQAVANRIDQDVWQVAIKDNESSTAECWASCNQVPKPAVREPINQLGQRDQKAAPRLAVRIRNCWPGT